jgi:hypothetical protein
LGENLFITFSPLFHFIFVYRIVNLYQPGIPPVKKIFYKSETKLNSIRITIKRNNMTRIFYFFNNIINLLTTVAIIIAVFFDDKNLVSNKQLLFMIFLNLSTHITDRTRNLQKD